MRIWTLAVESRAKHTWVNQRRNRAEKDVDKPVHFVPVALTSLRVTIGSTAANIERKKELAAPVLEEYTV